MIVTSYELLIIHWYGN